jgi:hypothetical protein
VLELLQVHEPADIGEDNVEFSTLTALADVLEPVTVFISSEKYEEMGEPELLTVTIEPGDTLNHPGGAD